MLNRESYYLFFLAFNLLKLPISMSGVFMNDFMHLEINEQMGRELSYSMDDSTGILHVLTLLRRKLAPSANGSNGD